MEGGAGAPRTLKVTASRSSALHAGYRSWRAELREAGREVVTLSIVG